MSSEQYLQVSRAIWNSVGNIAPVDFPELWMLQQEYNHLQVSLSGARGMFFTSTQRLMLLDDMEHMEEHFAAKVTDSVKKKLELAFSRPESRNRWMQRFKVGVLPNGSFTSELQLNEGHLVVQFWRSSSSGKMFLNMLRAIAASCIAPIVTPLATLCFETPDSGCVVALCPVPAQSISSTEADLAISASIQMQLRALLGEHCRVDAVVTKNAIFCFPSEFSLPSDSFSIRTTLRDQLSAMYDEMSLTTRTVACLSNQSKENAKLLPYVLLSRARGFVLDGKPADAKSCYRSAAERLDGFGRLECVAQHAALQARLRDCASLRAIARNFKHTMAQLPAGDRTTFLSTFFIFPCSEFVALLESCDFPLHDLIYSADQRVDAYFLRFRISEIALLMSSSLMDADSTLRRQLAAQVMMLPLRRLQSSLAASQTCELVAYLASDKPCCAQSFDKELRQAWNYMQELFALPRCRFIDDAIVRICDRGVGSALLSPSRVSRLVGQFFYALLQRHFEGFHSATSDDISALLVCVKCCILLLRNPQEGLAKLKRIRMLEVNCSGVFPLTEIEKLWQFASALRIQQAFWRSRKNRALEVSAGSIDASLRAIQRGIQLELKLNNTVPVSFRAFDGQLVNLLIPLSATLVLHSEDDLHHVLSVECSTGKKLFALACWITRLECEHPISESQTHELAERTFLDNEESNIVQFVVKQDENESQSNSQQISQELQTRQKKKEHGAHKLRDAVDIIQRADCQSQTPKLLMFDLSRCFLDDAAVDDFLGSIERMKSRSCTFIIALDGNALTRACAHRTQQFFLAHPQIVSLTLSQYLLAPHEAEALTAEVRRRQLREALAKAPFQTVASFAHCALYDFMPCLPDIVHRISSLPTLEAVDISKNYLSPWVVQRFIHAVEANEAITFFDASQNPGVDIELAQSFARIREIIRQRMKRQKTIEHIKLMANDCSVRQRVVVLDFEASRLADEHLKEVLALLSQALPLDMVLNLRSNFLSDDSAVALKDCFQAFGVSFYIRELVLQDSGMSTEAIEEVAQLANVVRSKREEIAALKIQGFIRRSAACAMLRAKKVESEGKIASEKLYEALLFALFGTDSIEQVNLRACGLTDSILGSVVLEYCLTSPNNRMFDLCDNPRLSWHAVHKFVCMTEKPTCGVLGVEFEQPIQSLDVVSCKCTNGLLSVRQSTKRRGQKRLEEALKMLAMNTTEAIEIDLSNGYLSDSHIHELINVLRQRCCPISVLDLTLNTFSERSASQIFSVFEDKRDLFEVRVSPDFISPITLRLLANLNSSRAGHLLFHRQVIVPAELPSKMDLSGLGLCDFHAEIIHEKLLSGAPVRILNVSGNTFTQKGCSLVAEGCRRSGFVEQLALDNYQHIVPLHGHFNERRSRRIALPDKLRQLVLGASTVDLSSSKINDDCMEQICCVLQSAGGVTSVCLANNLLTDACAAPLLVALKQNLTLNYIDLHGNELVTAAAFESHSHLCQQRTEAAAHVAQLEQRLLSSDTVIEMCDLLLSDREVPSIVHAMAHSASASSTRKLDFSGNAFTSEGVERISKAALAILSLEEIQFYRNLSYAPPTEATLETMSVLRERRNRRYFIGRILENLNEDSPPSVDLSSMDLRDEEAVPFFDRLQAANTRPESWTDAMFGGIHIQHIDISGNRKLTNKAAERATALLHQVRSITQFDVLGCPLISDEEILCILNAAAANRQLAAEASDSRRPQDTHAASIRTTNLRTSLGFRRLLNRRGSHRDGIQARDRRAAARHIQSILRAAQSANLANEMRWNLFSISTELVRAHLMARWSCMLQRQRLLQWTGAEILQRIGRGFFSRHFLFVKSRQKFTVALFQCVGRGWLCRRMMGTKQKESAQQFAAAVRIQRLYRGGCARTAMQRHSKTRHRALLLMAEATRTADMCGMFAPRSSGKLPPLVHVHSIDSSPPRVVPLTANMSDAITQLEIRDRTAVERAFERSLYELRRKHLRVLSSPAKRNHESTENRMATAEGDTPILSRSSIETISHDEVVHLRQDNATWLALNQRTKTSQIPTKQPLARSEEVAAAFLMALRSSQRPTEEAAMDGTVAESERSKASVPMLLGMSEVGPSGKFAERSSTLPQQLAQIRDSGTQPYQRARLLNEIAVHHHQAGRHCDALHCIQQALAIQDEHKSCPPEFLINHGVILVAMNDPTGALRALRSALQLLRQIEECDVARLGVAALFNIAVAQMASPSERGRATVTLHASLRSSALLFGIQHQMTKTIMSSFWKFETAGVPDVALSPSSDRRRPLPYSSLSRVFQR